MVLQPHECEQFYRIWWSLLNYVNNEKQLISDFSTQVANNNINFNDAAVIRNVLWSSDSLLQNFIDKNPDNLSDIDLELTVSWEKRVVEKFIITRHLKKYSLFLHDSDNPTVYGVIGILSPISEIISFQAPIMVNAVLLPFGDRIIFDSLLNSYNVRFGGGIRKGFNNQIRRAEELKGIITNLNEDNSIQAIIDGNKKILGDFRKWLAKKGLSIKMQHEHYANVEAFVIDRFVTTIPSSSLLNLCIDDFDTYFNNHKGKVNKVSFKRLIKFLSETDRIEWDYADKMEHFLK